MKISQEQRAKITKLKQWFAGELSTIKRKEIEVKRRYEKQRGEILRKKILKKINTL